MGAGILPVAYHKGNWYFLFARENKGLWSDFGGSKEKNETHYQTAVREGFEESNGILGDAKNIRNLIKNNCITTVGDKGWTTYIIKVKYNKKIIKLFQDNFKKVLKDTPEIVKEKNGLYEKDKLRWVKLQNLKKNMGIFRPWYKKFVKQILYQFE